MSGRARSRPTDVGHDRGRSVPGYTAIVHRDEPDRRIVLDERLRAVAVVDIPVDDQ